MVLVGVGLIVLTVGIPWPNSLLQMSSLQLPNLVQTVQLLMALALFGGAVVVGDEEKPRRR